MGKKLWRYISFSSTYFCYYRKHPNNNNKIYSLLSFMTDSQYLGIIQIWWNLNEYYYYLTSPKSFIYQIALHSSRWNASFRHQIRKLKTDLLQFNINFSRHFFKTSTLCLLFLSSHVFDSNYFGILLWKIVKRCDHNETKPPIGKTSQ